LIYIFLKYDLKTPRLNPIPKGATPKRVYNSIRDQNMPRKPAARKAAPRRRYVRRKPAARTYTRRAPTSGQTVVPYSRAKDPAYQSSQFAQPRAKVTASKKNAAQARIQSMKGNGHFMETVPPGAPNKNHWRMCVMAPAHVMNILSQIPALGKYQQCRIPDFQVGDSVLVPAISKSSFSTVAGAAIISVYPSLNYMADSNTGAIFGGTSIAHNRAYADVWAAGPMARCVAYCVEVQVLDSSTNAQGRIGIVNLPADPYNMIAPTTMDSLANQSSALVVKSKDGLHMSWMPDANVLAWQFNQDITAPQDLYSAACAARVHELKWSYNTFWPNGLRTDGLKASSVNSSGIVTDPFEPLRIFQNVAGKALTTGATAVTAPTSAVQFKDMLPQLMIVVEGASTAAGAGNFMFNVYSHWEVVPDTRGKLSEPGATGQHASSGTGLLAKAEHVVSTVVHDVEGVVKTGATIAEDAWSVAKTVGKVAGLAAMLL